MSTPKPSREANQFKQPTIGPKVYLAVSSSGWTETFPRAHADKALAAFVAPAQVAQVLTIFVTKRRLAHYDQDDEDREINWFTITGFLARTLNCSPLDVPVEVAIAFWGQALIEFRQSAN